MASTNDELIEQLQTAIQNTSGVAVTASISTIKQAEKDDADDGSLSFTQFAFI